MQYDPPTVLHNFFKVLQSVSQSISNSFSSEKTDYDLLIEWGKNNSLIISDKIKIEYLNENNKTYYAKEQIMKGEEILNIPNSLLLNIRNALILYGQKMRKLYSSFKSELNVSSEFNLEQAFLAFMMYKVNKNKKSKNNDFYIAYQPIFNVKEQGFTAIKALIRLKDTELGYISPKEFIPLAEKNGVIFQIADFEFKEICKFIVKK